MDPRITLLALREPGTSYTGVPPITVPHGAEAVGTGCIMLIIGAVVVLGTARAMESSRVPAIVSSAILPMLFCTASVAAGIGAGMVILGIRTLH